MAKSKPKYQSLKNDLNDFDISDEQYEELRTVYEYEKGEAKGPNKGARFAKSAGFLFLILALLFIIQQFFFPYGPDLTNILRLVPAGGTILVILIGFGLLTRHRNRRDNRRSAGETSEDETTGSGHEFRRESKSGTYGSRPFDENDFNPAEEFDFYAFENRKRWYRSRKEKMLFGVCGGIGERFQIDPTVVRALFALAFLSYGFSLVIYIVLAIVLPKKPLRAAL